MMTDLHTSTYLNLDLDWPGFTLVNLDRHADGSLTLAQHPALVETVGADVPQDAPALNAPAAVPAGIAVTPDCGCDLYISDPARQRIWRFDTCVGTPVPLKCLRGPGALPGEVDTPRGLVIADAPGGQRLYVADSGNHRIQVIDLRTQQPLAVWGQPQPYLPPTPDAAPGRLNDPWDVAADSEGRVYVVDHGNRRVQRFLKTGQVDETFWNAAQMAALHEPVRVAVGDEWIFVLDRLGDAARVVVYDTNGMPHDSWAVGPADATALAVTSGAVYVGDFGGRIVKYSLNGQLLSTFESQIQPLAVLARGCDDALLAGSGGLPIVRLGEDQGYAHAGSFRAGPFQTLAEALGWHRVQVRAEGLSENSYLQLFTAVDTQNVPPQIAPGDDPFGAGWYALPRNELDGLVLSAAVRSALLAGSDGASESTPAPAFIWVGGLLRGDGSSSPIVRQIRLDFNPENLIRYMPATYRAGAQRRLFLELLLATVGADLSAVEGRLRGLTTYFEPAAAPPDWLPWIAGWLDFTLIEEWSQADTRRNIATAMQLYTQRGTVAGLKRYLELYAGVAARIEEPRVALFGLNDGLALGFNTVLAPAHEQGAVLASTATLGQSHLLAAEDIGVPVFEDIAHRFAVQVYAAQLAGPRTRDAVIATLEREKPAHTTYHLCVIDARMRVGFQARIGVDSIVAGPAPAMRLGDPAPLGGESVLADQPHRANGRLGDGIRVGAPLS